MSNNPTFPTSGNLYTFPALNAGVLYINGVRFEDYINQLVFEDQFEQTEITELKQLVQYLNTSGLTSEWIVDNNNKNQDLKTLITALQNKTRFITEASVTGTGDTTTSTYTTSVGPPSEEKGISIIEMKQKNAPEGDFIGYRIKSDFNDDDYDYNETLHSHPHGRFTIDCSTMRLKATEQIRIGNFNEYGDSLGGAVNIGGRGGYVNIGSIDSLSSGSMSTQIQIGKQSDTAPNTATRISGNVYLSDARFEDMAKSSSLTASSLFALLKSGLPGYILGFITGSTNLPLSDVWTMAGGFANTKNGSIETSNKLTIKELYVVNKDILTITPRIGFFLAKADYSCTQLIGSHRTQVFDGEITIRNNNITSTDVDWAFTEANDKCNVLSIKGDDGILLHQGASDDEKPITIVNSCRGGIELRLTKGGTKSGGEGLSLLHLPGTISNSGTETFVRIGTYMGGALGTSYGSYALEVNQYNGAAGQPETARDGMVIAKAVFNGVDFDQLLNVINADSINTPGTITGINLVGSTSISTNQATATSLVISGNYTGDTTNRLYKNADGKLFWNGKELGSNLGGGGGGLEYYIPLANNVTNPAPSPTTQFATETYTSSPQRTITQSTTAVATGILMAKYATGIITKESNPFVEGLQTIQQHLTWNQNNIVGQIYGQTWFQASASGAGAFIYDRSFTGTTITAGYQVLNGVPILAPQGLFNLTFQSVTFPGIYVDTFSGYSITMKCRLEAQDLITGNWNILQTSSDTSSGSITYTLDNQANQTITFNETFTHNQTSKINAPTAYRMVLFLTSSPANGQIYQQTFAGDGGNELIAYKLGSTAGNTAEMRVLLYDGVNAKQTITHTNTPSLVPIELPISPSYQIGAFNNGRLGFDIYMFQPSGSVNAGHQMTFYFGDGTISHIETTINEPPAPTPTLAQVLNSGATASQPINMNTNKISGITTLEGASNGNWNVKEISAGTNIGRSVTNGNYTITNDAPVQNIDNTGSNISVSITNKTATITNDAPVQNIDNTGSNISVSITNKTATISNNAPVQNIAQGTGISVSIDPTTKTATITNTVTAGGQVARDQLSATNSVGLVPSKLGHYAQNWTGIATAVNPQDIFVSQDGKNCVYIPSVSAGNSYVQYSNDYGATWYNSNLLSFKYESICGSIAGDILYLSRNDDSTGTSPNIIYTSRLYKSTNYGITWSEITLDRTIGAANTWYNRYAARIRCNSDGSVVMVTTYNTTSVSGVPNNGTLYISTTGGGTWVVRSLTTTAGTVVDCCMSANGAIMFATIEGVFGGSTDNGNGGIYRSFDYGATWTRVRTQIATGSFFFGIIKCDATGRFLIACDQSLSFPTGTGQIQTSDDFGSNWTWSGDEQARGANAAFVSPGGNLMIVAHNTGFNSAIRYSLDYGRSWTLALNMNVLIGANSIQSLASNHDGSVLLLDITSGNLIYRSYEERGRLVLGAGSTDLSITPSFGGGYTLYNIPAGEVLWYSGVTTTTSDTSTIFLDDFRDVRGKIDLTQFDIRYEMDILWNYTSVQYPQCWIGLGLNQVQASSVANPTQNNAQTTWTNLAQTTFTGMTPYDQVYTSRFYCGYSGVQGTGTAYRYRTAMKGNISLVTRQTIQFLNDPAMNSRLIQNDFECNSCLLEPHTTANQFRIFSATDSNAGQQTQRGVAVWEASYDNLWNLGSAGSNDLNSGVYRLYLRLTDTGTTNVPRGAEIKYSIYRVRK